MKYDWETLIKKGLIEVSENEVVPCDSEELAGKLIIVEGIKSIGARQNYSGIQPKFRPDSVPLVALPYPYRIYKYITSIVVPSSVTDIAYGYFNRSVLKSIIIDPDNETYDGKSQCNAIITKENNTLVYGLDTSTIPEGVVSIGENAFNNTTRLSSIFIPSKVTAIANDAFRGCTGLTSITVDSKNNIYDSRNECNAII